MAKLVPAVCPQCGGKVQLDPSREYVTCQFCGTSSFIQTQQRPVTQYVQARALPVIQLPPAQRQPLWIIAVVAGMLVAAVAIMAVVALIAGSVRSSAGLPEAAPLQPLGTPADASPATTLVEEDYFANPALALSRFEKVLGKPIVAKQLTLMQYYGTLEAQDPKQHEHVDSYRLWANQVESPQPVRLGSDRDQLDQILFSLDSIDFRLLPQLIRQALSELKLEESKVSHVMLERDRAGSDPVWRIYVQGSRDNGFVEFSAKGVKRRAVH